MIERVICPHFKKEHVVWHFTEKSQLSDEAGVKPWSKRIWQPVVPLQDFVFAHSCLVLAQSDLPHWYELRLHLPSRQKVYKIRRPYLRQQIQYYCPNTSQRKPYSRGLCKAAKSGCLLCGNAIYLLSGSLVINEFPSITFPLLFVILFQTTVTTSRPQVISHLA